MAEVNDEISIQSLPDEVLSIILENRELSCIDVSNFGATCTQFQDHVKSNQSLWKYKLKAILSPDVFESLNRNCAGNWMNEAKMYFKLKKHIHSELLEMSPKYYRRDVDLDFEDVRSFFRPAVSRSVNYFLSIWILCNIVKKGYKFVSKNRGAEKRPYTLTDVYYAKIVLRFLIHDYMMVKWSRMCRLKEMEPEKIVQFFLQWVDTANIHLEEAVEEKINDLVQKTESLLEPSHPLKSASPEEREMWAKGFIADNMWDTASNKKVLAAVTNVVFQLNPKAVTVTANLDTLDIVKVVNSNFGNVAVVAAIYEAVARRCGVRCDLVVFPNHLFLEWKEDYEQNVSQSYIVNLNNGGILERKRQCPFSQINNHQTIKYSPHSLLQHLLKSFNESMGAIRNFNTQNCFLLLDFLGTEYSERNPYRTFLVYLSQLMSSAAPEFDRPLRLKNMDEAYIDVIWSLANYLNRPRSISNRDLTVKKHESGVKYAVGMVCQHLKYDYVCVIRGWDRACSASVEWQSRMAIHALERGPSQPFYSVIAADYSERYVAQENLREAFHPNRLYHLEDMIAKEFSYFDGFAYIPNQQKLDEYPEDGPVREYYKACSELKPTS